MQTIVILLDPGKLINPDLDLRYLIPDRIGELTDGAIQDNGYDYLDREGSGPLLGIWLETGDAAQSWPAIAKLFHEEKFSDNDLSLSAEIYISEKEAADVEDCTLVYPL